MNPMLAAALTALFRWALAFLGGYAFRAGIWTHDETAMYVSGGAAALAGLVWSLWNHYKGRLTLLTALASEEPLSEQQAEARVASGLAPPVSSPKNVVPQ